MDKLPTSKIYTYLNNPDAFSVEILEWNKQPDIPLDITEPELERTLGRSWDLRNMPEEQKAKVKEPLLPREDFLELLKNDVLPVFLFSHGEFPIKNEYYSVFGEPRDYGKISKISDTYFKVPKDTILVNPDIEYRTYNVCSFNDDILGTYYGVNPDLLVGKSTKPHTFDYTRYDEINDLFRSKNSFEKKISEYMIKIFNHTNYYFSGDPFYNLMMTFEMNSYKTAFEYFLQEPKNEFKIDTTGIGNWGVYIQEDNVLKKIECEELFIPHYQTYLAKPHLTFEINKIEDGRFKMIYVGKFSEKTMKIHIKITDELAKLLLEIDKPLDKPLIDYLSQLYKISYTTFEDFIKEFYNKVLKKNIYNISLFENDKKMFGYTVSEQHDEIRLFSMYVFFFIYLHPDDIFTYIQDDNILKYIHQLTELPIVVEVYRNRYTLIGEDKPEEGILADEIDIQQFTLKDFIGKMTPLLKKGYCGVPIKKKIMYFLISCRYNYLPDVSWTDDEQKRILRKQEEINSIGNENTKLYKTKSNIFTRTAQQLFSKISDYEIKQMEEGMAILKLDQIEEKKKKRLQRIRKTIKQRKMQDEGKTIHRMKQRRRGEEMDEERSLKGQMEEERSRSLKGSREGSLKGSIESKRRRTRKHLRGGKKVRSKRTRKSYLRR